MNLKFSALLLAFLWQAKAYNEPPIATPAHLQFERAISALAGPGQACAVLDAQIFPHASPSLRDLRIFPSQNQAQQGPVREVPYAMTLSESLIEDTQPARILNLGTRGTSIVFDLEMPDRPYTEVALDLTGSDFLATATVSGIDAPGAKSTALGVFTLFDLSSQHLSRDTTLPLEESTFRYLHVVLAVSSAPGTSQAAHFVPAMVEGAQVPPSREAQTVYTPVAETASITTAGRESRATFVVPLRIPVERVSFALPPSFKGNFSRGVRVTAIAEPEDKAAAGNDVSQRGEMPRETVEGTILRVHTNEGGREIHTEQLEVPAILGANLQSAAKVEVTLENGDDQPLPITAVRLEMRQRKLCFEAPSSSNPVLKLYYGDPTLLAPVYDYGRLFVPAARPLVATLGPELLNATFQPPPAEIRPFTERHPEVLWIALIAVICVLGVVALKSSRNVGIKH